MTTTARRRSATLSDVMRSSRARRLATCGLAAACVATAAPAASQDVPQFSGSERLVWDQVVDAATLARTRFVAYVDGSRSPLAGVTCDQGDVGFTCGAPLPALAVGRHFLQLAAYDLDEPDAESARTPEVVFDLAPRASTAAAPATIVATTVRTLDGVQLRLDPVATATDIVTAVAVAADGTLLIAERGGALTIASRGGLARDRVAVGDANVAAGGLLAVAPGIDFARTRLAYVAYAALSRDGRPVLRIARVREAGGTFGDRVVVSETALDAPLTAAALKVGADGTLYVGWGRRLERMNPDGTTPESQPGLTPLIADGFTSVIGVDWQLASGWLWVADASLVDGARLFAYERPAAQRRASTGQALPTDAPPSAVAFAGADGPFPNDLWIASERGQALLKIEFDARDHMRIGRIERLLDHAIGDIRAVAVAPDGTVYVATAHAVARLVATPR